VQRFEEGACVGKLEWEMINAFDVGESSETQFKI